MYFSDEELEDYENAKSEMQNILSGYFDMQSDCPEEALACLVALKAIDKQIGKPLNYTYDDYYECTNCYTEVEKIVYYVNGQKKTRVTKYCSECGQKIERY